MNSKKMILFAVIISIFMSQIAQANSFTLRSSAFNNYGALPYEYSYCQPAGHNSIKAAGNISPPLKWVNAPQNTKSFALIITDPFIPNSPYFNQPGHILSKNTPRVTGYHWILVNIPKNITALPKGAGSKGFIPGGKKPGQTPFGLAGINIYTNVFKNPAMVKKVGLIKTTHSWQGIYGQYDGGCPPWNDKVIHYYKFKIYALDIAHLNLPTNGHFTGPDVLKVIHGHVLATSTLHAKIITNPILQP